MPQSIRLSTLSRFRRRSALRRPHRRTPVASKRGIFLWALSGLAISAIFTPSGGQTTNYTLGGAITAGTASWNQGATWIGGSIPAGAGNTADLSENVLIGPLTITLDGSQTIGSLLFGDAGNANNTFLAAGNAGTLTLAVSSGAPVIDVVNETTTISAVIQGASGFSKTGAGTLVLTNSEAYTGTTTVNAGTLTLDFSQPGAPLSNIINSATALAVGGGALNVIGAAGTANSQTFSGLTVNAGASELVANANATGSSVLLALGTISRNPGGTVDFAQPAGTVSSTNGFTASNGNTNGILGGWATVGGFSWATNNGTNIVALASYTTTTSAGTTAANYLANNIDVTSSPAPAAAITPNSLRFNTAGAETLTLTGTNVVSSGGILVTANVGSNLSKIAGGTIEGASGQDLVVIQNNTASSLTIASAIADNTSATGLTKSGAGLLTLSKANTYTGPTTINAGTLSLGIASAIGGSSSVSIDGGTFGVATFSDTVSGVSLQSGSITGTTGVLTSSSPYALQSGTVSAILAGTTGLTKSGSGAVLLSAANTYTGTTAINSGVLQISSINATTSTAQSLGEDNSAVALGGGSTAATLQYTGATAVTLARNITVGGAGGTIENSSGKKLTLSGALTFSGLPLTLTGGTFGVSGVIGGTGSGASLLVNNATVTVTGASNVYAGSTYVYGGGDLLLGVASGLPTTTTVTLGESTYNTGGTFDLNGFAQTITGLSNAGTGADIVTNSGAASKALTIDGTTTFGGVIQDGVGGISLVKASSSGTFTLSGANTFSGGTTIKNGTLDLIGGNNRLSVNGAVTLGNGSTNSGKLQLGNGSGASNQTVASLTLPASETGAANAVIGGNASVSTLTVNLAAPDLYAGLLGSGTSGATNSNQLALTLIGSGTLTLSNANNSYNGGTNVNGGTLVLGAVGALPSTGAVNIGGGVLDLAGNAAAVGAVTLSGGSIINSGAAASLSGSGYNVQSGVISAPLAGAAALTKTTSGTVTLSATNSFTGGTTVNAGLLSVGASNALGSGPLTVAGGVLDLAGYGNTVGAFTLSSGNIVNSGGPAALTASGFSVQSGEIDVVLAGAGSALTKSGAGAVTLTAANTYTGATTINGGTLNLTTAQTGGGALVVNDGGALGLSLSAAGQSLAASSFSLGNSTGAVLNLSLGSFGNPTAPVVGAGGFTTAGTNTLNIAGAGLSVGVFPLIGYTGAIGGAGFGGLSLGGLPARVTANLIDDSADSLVELDITAFDVPRWTGAVNGSWNIDDGSGTVGTLNWKLSNNSPTGYYQGGAVGTDSVIFDDSATGTTTVNLTAALSPISATVNNSVLTYTFVGTGKLTGAATLTKEGSAALILANTGANDYTGLTTISAGTLQVGDGVDAGAGQLGSGNVVISGGTLAFNRPLGDDITVRNAISGSGAFVQEGGDALTLTGNNASFSGTFTVAGGVLKVGSINALGSATAVVTSGGTLDVTGYSIANALQLNGGSLRTTAGSGTVVSGPVTLSNGPIIDVAGGSTLIISGSISGSGGFSTNDAGVLVLSGNNNYAGVTTLAAGTIQLGNANALGGAGAVVQAGAVLDLAGYSANEPLQLQGGSLRSSVGAGGGVSAAVTLTGNATADVVTNATLTLSGPIGGSGSLTKTSAGTLILSGSNGYGGGTDISAGAVQFASAAAVPSAGTIGLGAGSEVVFGFSFDQTFLSRFVAPTTAAATIVLGADNANSLSLVNHPAVSVGALTTANYSGPLTSNGSVFLLGGGGGVITISSALTGSNGLNVGTTGPGTVVLAAANSFNGGTTVTAGALKLANAGALGPASNPLTVNGILDLGGFSETVGNLSGSGAITDSSSNPGTSILTVDLASGGSYTYAGGINDGSNGRSLALALSGSGTLILNKANGSDYSGGTTISGGILNVRTNNAQVLPNGSTLTFTGTSSFVDQNNGTGAGSLSLGALAFNGGDATITSDQSSTGTTDTLTFAGAPTRSPGATGAFTLQTATDPSKYKVVFSLSPSTGQSLDGGVYFIGSSGASFAAYNSGTGYVRALAYGTDANAVAVSGAQATLGSVTGNDVQITAGTGDITDQTSISIRTLNIAGNDNLFLDNPSSAILTLSAGGILKTGGSAATISGGGGLTAQGEGDLVVRTDQAADTLTIATSILASTTGGLTKTGPGTLVLSGPNAYGGTTWINAGVLRANDGVGLASGNLTIDGGVFETGANFDRGLGAGLGQVQLSGASGFSANGGNAAIDLSGAAAGGAYTVVWGASGFAPTTLTLNAATASSVLTFTNGLDLNGGAQTITVAANTAVISGAIVGTGGGSLTKTGAGTLQLAGGNTYAGGTTVSAGTLQVGNIYGLGVSPSPVTVNGSTLDLNGFNVTVGALTANATGLVTDVSATGNTTLTVDSPSGTSTFAGAITNGAGTVALVKTGPGSLILNKANGNTYSGGTFVNAGVLEVRTNNAQVLKSGSSLTFTGPGSFVAGNDGTGTGSLTLGALSFSAGDGAVTSSQESTGAANTLTFASVSRQPGATGNFTLATATNPSTYKVVITSAPTTGQSIDGGLFFGGSSFAAYDAGGFVRALQYGTDANAVAVSGGQATLGSVTGNDVQITGGTGDITDQTSLSIRTLNIAGNDNLFLDNPSSATLALTAGGILKSGGGAATITGGGGVTAPGGEGDLVVRTDQAADSLTIATPILASTTGGLTKSGAGSLTLASPNTFTGPTNINAGTLTLADPGALQNSTLNLNSSGGTFSFGALTSATLGGLSGNQNLPLTNAVSGNVAVTVGGNNQNTNFYASLSGGGSLTKVGTGTLTLSGLNSYTGSTSVMGGVLEVAGSMTNGLAPEESGTLGSVAVNNGGALAGAGIVGPVTVNSGGLLQPGNLSGLPASPLNVASLTLGDGSAFALNLGALTSDSVVATGAISLTGTVNLTLNLTADPTEGAVFPILSGASIFGDLSWQGAPLTEGSLFSATTGSFSQLFEITYQGAGGTAVDLIAVPEPSSLATLFGSLGLLLGCHRLRRGRSSSRA